MAGKKKKTAATTGRKKGSGRKSRKFTGLNFERPLTCVDLNIFAVRDNELCALLIQRPDTDNEPFPDHPALPGGFVDTDHDVDLHACAKRKLREKTGIETHYLEQVGSWGDAVRDPRCWSTTHVYFALIPYTDSIEQAENSRWVSVKQIIDNYTLAFDHNQLLIAALDRLRSKVEYTSLPAYLLQEPFTLPQLQQAYEVILDRALDKSSFRTRTLSADYLEETGLMKVEAPRPAMGYRLRPEQSLVFFPRPLKGDS